MNAVEYARQQWDLVEIGRTERKAKRMAKYTEWCPELEAALAEPFPRELHKNPQRGQKGIHVPVQQYVARLNALVGVGGWSMPAPINYHSGNKLGLAVGVTILGVTKWNVGDEMEDHGEPDEDNKVRDFGSSSTNSWAQAFKRCCAYGFGLGFYLYDKEWTKQYMAGRAQPQRTPDPSIRSRISERIAQFADPAVTLTEKQSRVVKIAQSIADQKNPDPTHLAQAVERLDALADEVLSLNGASA